MFIVIGRNYSSFKPTPEENYDERNPLPWKFAQRGISEYTTEQHIYIYILKTSNEDIIDSVVTSETTLYEVLDYENV